MRECEPNQNPYNTEQSKNLINELNSVQLHTQNNRRTSHMCWSSFGAALPLAETRRVLSNASEPSEHRLMRREHRLSG